MKKNITIYFIKGLDTMTEAISGTMIKKQENCIIKQGRDQLLQEIDCIK